MVTGYHRFHLHILLSFSTVSLLGYFKTAETWNDILRECTQLLPSSHVTAPAVLAEINLNALKHTERIVDWA